jgi:hypothetical protein
MLIPLTHLLIMLAFAFMLGMVSAFIMSLNAMARSNKK